MATSWQTFPKIYPLNVMFQCRCHLPAPAWDGDSPSIARRFGDHWLNARRSVVLVVPSVAAKLEGTAVVNPQHPSAVALLVSQSQMVIWDQRIFDCK
jgi:RES domain-containing protein